MGRGDDDEAEDELAADERGSARIGFAQKVDLSVRKADE